MKPQDLTINGWQAWLDKYRVESPNTWMGAAMRIENTPFTSARYAGGMTYKGEHYTYFEPFTGGTNPDGTPCVAWLMVRMDFLRWVTKELKREAKQKGGAK